MSFIAVGAVVAVGAGAGAAYLSAGGKPKVPGVPQIDFNAIQRDAIAGNQAAVGPAGKLASSVNQTNQTELDRIREGSFPGGKAAAQKIIMDQLMGVADIADTQAGIRNATAAGFNLGTGGSQFSKFGIVGHLGRTVGQQKQQGLGNMMAYQQFSEAPRYNPSSMFLSPESRLQVTMQQNKMNYDAAMAAAAIAAQPSAGAKAAAGGLGALSSIAGMFTGSAIGGGFGGGMLGGMVGGAAGGMLGGMFGGGGRGGGGGPEYGNVGSLTAGGAIPSNGGYNAMVGVPNWYSSQGWNTPQYPSYSPGGWG